MKTKRPMYKETVGAQYYAFDTPDKDGNFSLADYEETIRTDTVKQIGTTENGESTTIYASGKDYATFNKSSSTDLAVEVIAFPAEDLARMRGETVSKNGLILSGKPGERPYFAYGKVVKKANNNFKFEWYPKCQLIENTDDIATSEDSFDEQTDTVTIRSYPYDKDGNNKVYVDSEMDSFPADLTEEKFFSKPITSEADLDAILTKSA